MQRYFARIENQIVNLSNEDQHHILHVMRYREGDLIEVVSEGKLFLCKIDTLNPLIIRVNHEIINNSELNKNVTLFFPLAKGDKIDLVVQKCTELGVNKIVLVSTKRCVVSFEKKDIDKKISRFQKIAKEASEQSKRLNIPEILGVFDIKNIPENLLCDINLLAYEKESSNSSNKISSISKDSVSIFIGPEGGFEEDEVSYLNKVGFMNVSLGKRILRCETAAIYSLSVLSYLIED